MLYTRKTSQIGCKRKSVSSRGNSDIGLCMKLNLVFSPFLHSAPFLYPLNTSFRFLAFSEDIEMEHWAKWFPG